MKSPIKLLLVIALLFVGTVEARHGVYPTNLNTIQTLKIGAGGQLTGIDIQCDQGVGSCNNSGTTTKIVRTDTYGAYELCGSTWVQLVTTNTLPPSDPSNAPNICGNGNYCGVYEIRIAPSDTNKAYMNWNGTIYKTSNLRSCASMTWTATTAITGIGGSPNVNTKFFGPFIGIDPTDATKVIVGSPNSGAYYSTNSGTSWTAITGLCTPTSTNGQGDGYQIAFDLSNHLNVYIECFGTGVYKSTTGVSGTFTLTSGGPVSVAHIKSDSAGIIYAVGDGTANIQKYNGTTWSTFTTGLTEPRTIAFDPANNNNIVAIDALGSTSYTTGGSGGTWSGASAHPVRVATDIPWLANTNETNFTVGEIAYNSAASNSLFTAEGIGSWVSSPSSSTSSQTYTSNSSGIEQLVTTWIASPPGGKPILTAWDRPVWTVTNPAAYPSNHGVNYNQAITEGFGADWCSQNPSTIYLVANAGNSPFETSAKSTNGGGTGTPSDWTLLTTVPSQIFGQNGFGGHVACLDSTHAIWQLGNEQDLFITQNGGTTWTNITSCSGVPVSPSVTGWGGADTLVRHIVAADRVANTYYAYNYFAAPSTDGVYSISADGSTCTRVKTSQFDTSNQSNFNATLKTVPGNSGHLFFSSGPQLPVQGLPLWFNTGGGTGTWNTIANVIDVFAFGLGKAKAGFNGYPTLYCWCSVDTGSGHNTASYGLWQAINVNTTPIWRKLDGWAVKGSVDAVYSIEGDADTYGLFYGGYYGSGFFYGQFD